VQSLLVVVTFFMAVTFGVAPHHWRFGRMPRGSSKARPAYGSRGVSSFRQYESTP
jgi:hypothetical protein